MANTVAYGFIDLKTLFGQQVNQVGASRVNEAVIASIDEYNRQLEGLISTLAVRTTDFKARYSLPSGGTLQPLDQFGNPLPVQPGAVYDVAFPIQGGGTGWGTNRVTRALMTVEDANVATLNVTIQDANWVRRHMLAALFTNTTVSFTDPNYGALTIQPLANSDGTAFPLRNGTTEDQTHYLAQANAIDDGAYNPFPIIEEHINEHPGNSGSVIVLVPTNLVTSIRALESFHPAADPNLSRGIANDAFVGSGFDAFGQFIGYEDSGVKIVHWSNLPDSYMVAFSEGADPVLGMREYPAPQLQGLFPEFDDVDGNRQINKFIRYAGFGVRNRVAALVYRIGNANYAIPTGYTAPLAV